MLVLTRHKNQTIVLGDDIKITIVDIDGDRVRLGIDAPKTMRIMRAEIIEEVRQTNQESVKSNAAFMKKISEAKNIPKRDEKTSVDN
jgi:carbon storage regulator